MKKVMFLTILILGIYSAGFAQNKKQKAVTKKAATAKKATAKKVTKAKAAENSAQNFTLLSSNSYRAYAPSRKNFRISDPVVMSLNERTYKTDYSTNQSGILGVHKRMYGFNNGRLFLRSTDAPGSGTITGSGSVGTGTSIGSTGTSGHGIGVNGKSPDAGPGIYGIPGPKPVTPRHGNMERKNK